MKQIVAKKKGGTKGTTPLTVIASCGGQGCSTHEEILPKLIRKDDNFGKIKKAA